MINKCPYYYKNEKKENQIVAFEHCHKPKDIKNCPEGRRDNECIVVTLEVEDAIWNLECNE